MTCTHKMKNIFKAYLRNNLEIKLLKDVLKSYSHAKMDKIFGSDNLKVLFEFFIKNHKVALLSNYTGEQKTRYEDEIDEMLYKFRHFNQLLLIE